MPHAKLAPSSAARRVACPGSRALEERYPELVESTSSREGTAAHWVAQEYLLGRYSLPATAPNGEPITKEMHEGADLYEHTIKWISNEHLHIEETLDISNIHPQCWGTPDCWVIVDGHLHVFDYKFGHGYVEVFKNWQLLEYAAGVANVAKEPITQITLTVVQPRNYCKEGPVRSWTFDRPLLDELMQELIVAEAKAAQEEALCLPNPECLHCRASHACAALQDMAGRYADLSQNNTPHDLDGRQTGLEIRHLRKAASMIQARLIGLEEQAKSLIMRGEYVQGLKLEPSSSREYWTKEVSEVITLGELLGVDLAKPTDVITPTQARKAGIDDEVLKQYAERVPGKLKLVEEKNATKVFKK